MKLFTIESGFFSTDGGAMFGIMSQKIWSKRYPVDKENRCPLAMRCLFVDFGDRKVLFDAGAGMKPLEGMSYYRFHDLTDIEKSLNENGYRAEEVTDVVLSHLHFDHCGGCTKIDATGRIVMTFPNARHWTTREQWENSLHPSFWEADSYLKENMQIVYESGKLNLIDQDTTIFPGLSLKIYQGHTFGQLVSYITTDEGNYIFSGDVIPMLLHVMQGCVAAIDNYALKSVEEKVRLLQDAYQSDSQLFFYHDSCTKAATLKRQNGHISAANKIDCK